MTADVGDHEMNSAEVRMAMEDCPHQWLLTCETDFG